MKQELLSVNVATFNRAHLLGRCLDSVINQDYKNIEIIIVDDCSTDNTKEIVVNYQSKDPRIKYIRHSENKGLAHARNSAISASKGEYIALMDDDDEWITIDKLSNQIAIFRSVETRKNLGLVCSSVRLYHDKNNYSDKLLCIPSNLEEKILYGNGFIYSPTVLIRKQVFTDAGGYDCRLKRGVDSDLFRTAIIEHGYKIHVMNEVTTAIHEYGDDRITQSQSEKSLLKDTDVHLLCLNKFKNSFNVYQRARSWRKRSVLRNYLRLAILTNKPVYLVKFLRSVFL